MEAVREEKALLYQEIHWQQISAQVPTALPKERTLVVPFSNSHHPFSLVSVRFCWCVCVLMNEDWYVLVKGTVRMSE